MKVICVAKTYVSSIPTWAKDMHIPYPVIGTEYTVTNTIIKADGLTYYELVGFVKQEIDARAFATLPGLSADEMAEIEKEAIIR